MASIRSVNPNDPSEVVFEIEPASAAEIDSALEAGVEAQGSWAADSMLRLRGLGALADEIEARRQGFVDLMVQEVGKPEPEAAGEVDRAVSILRFYAQIPLDPVGEVVPGSVPGARVLVERNPLGLVLAICPWNFPLAIPLWKAAPALAYGNTVVIKPASPAIATANLLVECAREVLPPGVLQVLPIKLEKMGRTAIYGSFFNFYLCDFRGRVRLPGITVPVNYTVGAERCDLG